MDLKNWKTELLTIPNLLSLLRLSCIPWYMALYRHGRYFAAGAVFAISCLTDLMDGKIARQYHMVSRVGKVLDPLADKATQFALTLCLSRRYPVLLPVLILFGIKELFQLFAAVLALSHKKILPGALYAGKLCTTVLFLSLMLLVLFPGLPSTLVAITAATDILFLLYSFLVYWDAYYGKNRKIQDI